MLRKKQIKRLDANAYRYGTQDVPLDSALNEVESAFEERREEASRKATDQIKGLEARNNTLTARKADADERWHRMNTLTGGREPEFVKPFLAVLVAFALIFADGLLLAPVMDGLNIADPTVQLIVAIVLVTAFSLLLKISVHNYRQAQRKLWLVIAPAAFSLTALAIFGWWRGTEVVFASAQYSDGANTFAAENPLLTKTFITLATVALPVGAALALEYGLEKLRQAHEWRKARSDFQRFSKRLDRSQKSLEAAEEKRDHEREKLAKTRDEWLNAAKQAHADGQRTGAQREPFARVLLKIIFVGLLIVALTMVISYVIIDGWLEYYLPSGLARFALYLLAALGLAGWYAERQWRRWDRPTAEELYERRPTHWHNAPEAPRPFLTASPKADGVANPNGDKKDESWAPTLNQQAPKTKLEGSAN